MSVWNTGLSGVGEVLLKKLKPILWPTIWNKDGGSVLIKSLENVEQPAKS
jgi:hypothetical protein